MCILHKVICIAGASKRDELQRNQKGKKKGIQEKKEKESEVNTHL